MRWLAALAVLACAGCLGSAEPDGKFVYYEWSRSVKQCNDDGCTYGENREPFSLTLECPVDPTLSWDANSWIHGSVTARVKDDAGALVASRTVSADGHGSQVVRGKAGTWTFEGSTSDANGNMEIRLSCA